MTIRVRLGKFSAAAVKRAQDLRTGLPLASFARRRPRRRQGNRSAGPAIGAAAVLLEYRLGRLRRKRQGRHRAAGSRLLAANAKTRRGRNDRAVAVCLSATARQRDGAGIAARRRVVQDRRSEDRGRPRHARHPAKDQPVAAAGRLSGHGASRAAGGLPDPVQDRRRQRRWPPAGRGRRQSRALGLSRSSVPHPLHGRPTGQSARRTLSICRPDPAATGGAAALARKENRSAQAFGRAARDALAVRQALA